VRSLRLGGLSWGWRGMWGCLQKPGRKPELRRRTRENWSAAPSAETLEVRSLLSAATIQVPATRDTTIYDVPAGNLANGAGEFLVVGGASGGIEARRGLIYFDLSTSGIPAGSTVLDVVLTMHVTQTDGSPSSIGLHPITSPWLESGSNAPGNELNGGQAHEFDATWTYSMYDGVFWETPGGDFSGASAATVVDVLGAYEWSGGSLVDDVQLWLDDSNSNFGWLLKGSESGLDLKAFTSRHSDNIALRPVLEISFESPILPPIVSGRQFNDLDGDGVRLSPNVLQLNLQYSGGRNFFNLYGGQEYWYQSVTDSQWYFLRPDGSLTKWDRSPGKLTGIVVEHVDIGTWNHPDALLGSPDRQAESWIDGVTFQLVNSSGEVIDTTVSRSIDLNGDGVIQDEHERGWYRFGSIEPGNYTVRQVPMNGWVQSDSRTSGFAQQAWTLDFTLQLSYTGNFHQNFGGLGERWLQSSSGWHYITPLGDLYRWNGQSVSASKPLAGSLVASLNSSYFRIPSLLYAAINPVQTVTPGSTIESLNFGSYQPARITGHTWNDVNPDGQRNPPEYPGARPVEPPSGIPPETARFQWYIVLMPVGGHPLPPNPTYRETYFYITDLGQLFQWSSATGSVLITTVSSKAGVSPATIAQHAFAPEPLISGTTVQLLDEFGNVVATAVSTDRDLNNNGSIEQDSERGWYEFAGLSPGRYTVRQVPQTGYRTTSNGESNHFATVQTLVQQYGFKSSGLDHYNFGGLKERWFLSRTNVWFYVTPQGTVFEWNRASGGAAGTVKGRQVAQLSSSFYLNLNLLYQPVSTTAMIQGNQAIALDLGACRLSDSLFADISNLLV